MGTLTYSLNAWAVRVLGPDSETPFTSYSSNRPCPICSRNMHYSASLTMAAIGRYLGVCTGCGYRDPHKVQLTRSCEGPMVILRN